MMKLDMSALETQFGAPAGEDGGLLFDVDGAGMPAMEFPNCADVRNRSPASPPRSPYPRDVPLPGRDL
jgi:hypothetical protein